MIAFGNSETERSHIPDLRVFLEGGEKELWENKRRAGVTAEVEELKSFLESALPQHGYNYRLKIAEEAETQPAKRNRELVTYFGYRRVDIRERECIRLLCHKNGSVSWGEAHNGDFGKFGRHILCRLFIEGMLIREGGENDRG